MQDLTSGPECNKAIEHELQIAGIKAVRGKLASGQVISSVTGRLGTFTFRRAGSYWAVEGLVPLEAAREMHADPVGRNGLKVGGHYARPAPGQFATVWLDPKGNLKLRVGDKDETEEELAALYPAAHRRVKRGARVDFVTDPALCGRGFVDGYHIDTDDGLLFFVATLRRYGLA